MSSSSFTVPPPSFTLPPVAASNKEEVWKCPVVKLNSGYDMPVVAYGTFRTEPGQVGTAVLEALKAGYRHLDLAHIYGNEAEIGVALQQAFQEGIVKREDLFITGKLWNSDHEVDVVPQACRHSLKDLQLEYFDLYLVHFPVAWKFTGLDSPAWGGAEFGDTPLIDTWRAMERLVDAGLCKSIGVSNYALMTIHDLVTQARIRPACNQIEVHPYYTRDSLVHYCRSRGIAVVAHTPLGGGMANKTSWKAEIPMEDEIIIKAAQTHGVTPARVCLRWALQRGIVVLPKSVKPSRMAENLNVFGFELTPEELKEISQLDKYRSYKTNPNPLAGFLGGPDALTPEGTDIFD